MVKNLINWSNKYKIRTIFTNKNFHITKFMYEELKMLGKPNYLDFVN